MNVITLEKLRKKSVTCTEGAGKDDNANGAKRQQQANLDTGQKGIFCTLLARFSQFEIISK